MGLDENLEGAHTVIGPCVVGHDAFIMLAEHSHALIFGVSTMAEGVTYKYEPDNVDEMIETLKKSAKAKGFTFKGDKKSGKASNNEGITITYSVTGNELTIKGELAWNLWEMEEMIKGWLKGYKK